MSEIGKEPTFGINFFGKAISRVELDEEQLEAKKKCFSKKSEQVEQKWQA